MSTSFTTEPKIPYEEVLKCPLLTFIDPPEPTYVMRHKLMHRASGEKGTLWVYEVDGMAEFERFGMQDPTILQIIIDHFKVKVIDEYTCEWPTESGG